MSSELFDAEEFLYSTLTSDVALEPIEGEEPDTQYRLSLPVFPYVAKVFPSIVFSEMTASDTTVIGAERIQVQALYLVKVIGKDCGFEGIDEAVTRLDELLQKSSGTTSDGQIYGCIRERPYNDVEIDGKNTYYHRGGIYRIFIKSTL